MLSLEVLLITFSIADWWINKKNVRHEPSAETRGGYRLLLSQNMHISSAWTKAWLEQLGVLQGAVHYVDVIAAGIKHEIGIIKRRTNESGVPLSKW